jgi:hypothetical protein
VPAGGAGFLREERQGDTPHPKKREPIDKMLGNITIPDFTEKPPRHIIEATRLMYMNDPGFLMDLAWHSKHGRNREQFKLAIDRLAKLGIQVRFVKVKKKRRRPEDGNQIRKP